MRRREAVSVWSIFKSQREAECRRERCRGKEKWVRSPDRHRQNKIGLDKSRETKGAGNWKGNATASLERIKGTRREWRSDWRVMQISFLWRHDRLTGRVTREDWDYVHVTQGAEPALRSFSLTGRLSPPETADGNGDVSQAENILLILWRIRMGSLFIASKSTPLVQKL